MKKLISFTVVVAVAMMLSNAYASDEWDSFSDNLVQALQSDNDGLKASAMQMIIKHGDKVYVNDAAIEVYRVFVNHENVKMRQLALNALYKMQNQWFFDRISEEINDEVNPLIRHQLLAIAAERLNAKINAADTRLASN
jgi:hypothetical protein